MVVSPDGVRSPPSQSSRAMSVVQSGVVMRSLPRRTRRARLCLAVPRRWTGLPVLRLPDQPLVPGLDGVFSTFENQADVLPDCFGL